MKSVAAESARATSPTPRMPCRRRFSRSTAARRGFRGGSSVSTWLYRILVNTCYDLMRKGRRRPEAPLPARIALGAGTRETIRCASRSRWRSRGCRARADGVSSVRGRGLLAPRGGRDPRGQRERRRARCCSAPSAGSRRRSGRATRSFRRRRMKASCRDLERALSGGEPELWPPWRSTRGLRRLRARARGVARDRRRGAVAAEDVALAGALAADPAAARRGVAAPPRRRPPAAGCASCRRPRSSRSSRSRRPGSGSSATAAAASRSRRPGRRRRIRS